ncbi:MAG TPA: NAD-dependent dihydropyrimidine dehydrogenase subunit PreA [bacterium]|nr:NAD-dependent dihydropyrimidine dehydrogenase subunit PreA [bacterium]
MEEANDRAMYPEPKADLSVEFCGVKFESPFILAAAPPTDDLEMVRDAYRMGWAGAVLKTTSMEGTPVDLAYPMMSALDVEGSRLAGMGNIDLISEHHIDVVEKRVAELKKEFPEKRTIVSITGGSRESWTKLACRAKEAGADMIECSFSCPQGTLGLKPGAMLAQDPVASAKVVDWVKEGAGDTPVIIKLTPQVNDIVEIALAVKGAGANAVCVGNTLPSLMGVSEISGPDSRLTWVPVPNVGDRSTWSGLSGPAVKPVSLRCVAQVSRGAGMPIAGSGGATTWRDALEFVLLGASVVEFCTAVMHYGADIIGDLKEGLADHLASRGIERLGGIVGAALDSVVPHEELPRGLKWRPDVDRDRCLCCDLCMIACRDGGHRAISVDAERFPVVDDEKCVGCALCSAVCPAYCIRMEEKEP